MGKTKEYLVPFGILKIIEFIFLLIAWTTSMGAQRDDHNHYLHLYFGGKVTRPAFHIAMCLLTWIFVIFWFILGIGGIKMKFNSIISSILHFVFGVMLLIAASLVTDDVSWSDNHKYKTSVAFGIISAILLILDAFLYLLSSRYEGTEKPNAPKDPEAPKEPEAANESEYDVIAEEPEAAKEPEYAEPDAAKEAEYAEIAEEPETAAENKAVEIDEVAEEPKATEDC